MADKILVIGAGHLAFRIHSLAKDRGYESTHRESADFAEGSADEFAAYRMIYAVDDRDERNLETLISLVSLNKNLPITASLFNENIAPHLRAAHPNTHILNPAKIAAPIFVEALDAPLRHKLRYTPPHVAQKSSHKNHDSLVGLLALGFAALVVIASAYFHFFDGLSWLDAVYFVIVTVATVGYGDISLLNASPASKMAGIALIILSTFFIWLIFSLTIDNLVKRRIQLSLGRKKYAYRDHIILCGLGRLGFFIAEGLLDRGEKLIVIESNADSSNIEYLRGRGADVYVGNARLPQVLADAGVARAKALYSVINDDYSNLEIGLNGRSFAPDLRLVLRIFDESTSQKIKENLDINLTYSTTAIADEKFLETIKEK